MDMKADDNPADILLRFTAAVDRRDHEAAAACFAENGSFRPGETLIEGVSQIEAFYERRLADPRRRTSHIWANILIDRVDEDHVAVSATLSNYALEPQISETEVQLRIGRVTCELVRDARGTWLFAEQSYEKTFALVLPLSAAGPR